MNLNVKPNQERFIVPIQSVARRLLHCGHQIVDIKMDKYDNDNKRSVFIFKVDDNFENDMRRIYYEMLVSKMDRYGKEFNGFAD